MLTKEEVAELHGEKIKIHYIGDCENFYDDEVAPYYGSHEKYIREENGQLCQIHLPLSHYGKAWVAYAINPISVVYCKDCKNGRRKYLTRMGETVECQKCHHDDPRQYKELLDYCSQGVRRKENE